MKVDHIESALVSDVFHECRGATYNNTRLRAKLHVLNDPLDVGARLDELTHVLGQHFGSGFARLTSKINDNSQWDLGVTSTSTDVCEVVGECL
jgi:hypothetical protein